MKKIALAFLVILVLAIIIGLFYFEKNSKENKATIQFPATTQTQEEEMETGIQSVDQQGTKGITPYSPIKGVEKNSNNPAGITPYSPIKEVQKSPTSY